MPYVSQNTRVAYHKIRDSIRDSNLYAPGVLNYLMTLLAIRYWECTNHDYQAINDIMGALEGAKQEFYRRVAVPYEETKIKSNGDLYQ